MAAPTTITETDLATNAHLLAGSLASSFGWSVAAGSYDPIVTGALAEFGVADVSEVSGVAQVNLLMACLRWSLWNQVTQLTNNRFNIGADGSSLNLRQVNENARKSAEQALKEIERLRTRIVISTDLDESFLTVTRADDPFEQDEDYLDSLSDSEDEYSG